MKKPTTVSKNIAHVSGCTISNMICHTCKEKITEGLFLVAYHAVSVRGNEDDFYRVYHQKCSKNDPTWHQAYLNALGTYEASKQQLELNRQKAIDIIKNARYIKFDEDECLRPIIIYSNKSDESFDTRKYLKYVGHDKDFPTESHILYISQSLNIPNVKIGELKDG